MSDGGQSGKLLESGNEIEVVNSSIASSSNGFGNDFGRSISRIAVAQICESVGFEGFNESGLESLADIAVRYLFDLGKTSKSYANLAGRTECNVLDVIQGLEDLGFGFGFFGGAEVNECRMSSGIVKEIIGFVDSSEDIPFAQPVPSFPVVRPLVGIPSFREIGEIPEAKHVPDWLPAFPDVHTYRRTPVWNERVTDPREDKIELARQRRKAERSFLSLQQRLVGVDVEEPEEGLGEKTEANGIENPFVSKPLQAGEKDVTLPILPAEQAGKKASQIVIHGRRFNKEGDSGNHSSFLDTFAPAIEATKDVASESSEQVKRPGIRLEFKRGNKFLHEPFDLSLQNKNAGRTASCFGRDDERDDKKRRAEYILRQALENQQDIGHL